ncbi:MAG: septum formation initiator family protein [Bacteroidales bacterium]|nr:septum formation initiator family protein [Bacteroidales bacterium]
MIKKFVDKIPSILKNKYLLTGIAFLVLMLILDRNNLVSQYKMRKELNGLRKELKFYHDQAQKDSIEYRRLTGDSLELEKLGREKYMMKRDSEDIYIIVRKPVKNK